MNVMGEDNGSTFNTLFSVKGFRMRGRVLGEKKGRCSGEREGLGREIREGFRMRERVLGEKKGRGSG